MNRRRKSRKSNRLIPVIALLAVIGMGLLGVYFWEQRESRREAEQYTLSEEEPFVNQKVTLTYQGSEYVLRKDLDTYLLIGLDKVTDTLSDPDLFTNNQQADFLFLMIVDKANKSYSALHLNRDAMTEIQRLGMSGKKVGTFTGQLALSHTFGSGGKDSCRNTVQAVSHYLLDVPVEHYFSVTMDAIPVLNDLVGGVTVYIEDDFSAVDPALEQGKTIRLQGQQALTFIRSRWYVDDGTNLSRMNRQRTYINALYEQMGEQLNADSGFSARLASRLSDYSVSDLTTTELSNLADRLKDYSFTGIDTIRGEAVKGEKFMEFYTDGEDLQSVLVRLFFKASKA